MFNTEQVHSVHNLSSGALTSTQSKYTNQITAFKAAYK